MRWIVLALTIGSTSCSSHVRGAPEAGGDAGDMVDTGARDTGADAPASLDAPPFDAGPPVCVADAPSADVAGDTPLGPIDLRYGWAGRGNLSKACFEVDVEATSSAALDRATPFDRLSAWIPPHVDPVVGTHTGAHFTLRVGDREASTTGTVEIVRYTRDGVPNAVEARVAIEGGGWSVHGTVVGDYCDLFRDPCI